MSKRQLFVLASLFLCSSLSFADRSWGFSWSTETLNILTSDTTNWLSESTTRFSNRTPIFPYTFDSTEIRELQGLSFGPMAETKFRIDYNTLPDRLMLNGSGLTIFIPDCKGGDTIKVTTMTGNTTTPRGLTSINATRISNPAISLEPLTSIFITISDGHVGLTTNGGLHFYKIQVINPRVEEPPIVLGPQSWDFKALSSETMKDLFLDTSTWQRDSVTRFSNIVPFPANTPISANGNEITELKGLKFNEFSTIGKFAIDFGTTPSCLNLGGTNYKIIVPCSAGDTITIVTKTSNSATPRGVTSPDAIRMNGEETSLNWNVNVFRVGTADSAVFYTSYGPLLISNIHIGFPVASDYITTPIPDTTHKDLRSWHFTNWRPESLIDIAMDTINWIGYSHDDTIQRFSNRNPITENMPITASRKEIAELAGLRFGGFTQGGLLSIDFDFQLPRLMFWGYNCRLIVPGCTAGDTIWTVTRTANKEVQRGITATNGHRIAGVDSSLYHISNGFIVENNGPVEFITSSGFTHFFAIYFGQEIPLEIILPADTIIIPDTIPDTTFFLVGYPDMETNLGSNFSIPIVAANIPADSAVIAYQFTYHFNPMMIEYTGYNVDNSLSGNGFIVVNDSTSGELHISFMTITPIEGSGVLLNLQFKALNYGTSWPFISDFLFNTSPMYNLSCGRINVTGWTLGDVDGNDHIQAYDAALTLQYSVGIDPLPMLDPLPWTDARIQSANVDGVEGITANDAGIILQYSANLITTFPTSIGLRSTSTDADIEIVYNEKQLEVKSYGNLIGLNLRIDDKASFLGEPIPMTNLLSAINRKGETLSIGLASAQAPKDGSTILILPFATQILPTTLTFNAIINTTEKVFSPWFITSSQTPSKQGLCLYPNPATEVLNLRGISEGSVITVFDLSGKRLLEKTAGSKIESLSVERLDPGIYLISVTGQDNNFKARFIKQ